MVRASRLVAPIKPAGLDAGTSQTPYRQVLFGPLVAVVEAKPSFAVRLSGGRS